MNKDGKPDHAALRTTVEQLRGEANMPRKKVSECVKDLMSYCEERRANDYLVAGPVAGVENPFQEKKKCAVL